MEDRLIRCGEIDEEKGCLLYKGKLDRYGYGQISDKCKNTTVHRVSWKLANGEIPDGMEVCHSCDVKYPADSKEYRRCYEPTHLYLDTRSGNAKHMVESGRSVVSAGSFKKGDQVGEKNKNCRLTDKRLLEIYHSLTKVGGVYDYTDNISKTLLDKIKGETYPRLLKLLKRDSRL